MITRTIDGLAANYTLAGMKPSEIRSLFPGASARVQLNTAGIGLGSRPVTEAIDRFLATVERDPAAAYRGGDHERARAAAATLVGAHPGQIALIPATTLALNLAADAVPLGRGDNVVTCDLEFMSVIVPWLEKCRATGAELRVAKHVGGRILPDAVIAQIDGATRAVVLSAVQWTNGFRLDLAPIGAECRRRGIPFIVDAIQQVGALPLDVESCFIDYLACGGHKWLCSPSAMGFAYSSDGFAARYRPPLSYSPTAKPPGDGWIASWTDRDYDPIQTYDLIEDASRFEYGVHHAALAAAGLAAALDIFNSVGMAEIAAYNLGLADRAAKGLAELGFEILTPLGQHERSAITVFRAGPSTADDLALRDELQRQKIDVAVRYTSGVGGVRVATHFYNNEADVDRMLDVANTWKSTR